MRDTEVSDQTLSPCWDTHGIFFAWLINKMSQCFSVNVNNSAEQYLGLNYSMEEITNVISDIGGLEKDFGVTNYAVSEVKGRSFGVVMKVTPPFSGYGS